MDRATIKQFAPGGRSDLVQALVDNWGMILKAGIDTPLRVAHFMTQIATETGGFEIFEENMNYSAQRMCVVWPSRFPNVEVAQPYEHNPEKLANNVYGGRMGNVNPGDGWKYHGRGFMQTTGRENYTRIGHADDPEKLLDPKIALAAAIEEWTRGNLSAVADTDDLRRIRRVINGGLTGIDAAQNYLGRAKRTFTADKIGVAPAAPSEAPDQGAVMALTPTEQVQAKLKELGYYAGKIDGDIGKGSIAALLAYAMAQFGIQST